MYLGAELSYEVKGSYFVKKHSNWDGIVRLYTRDSASFPIGLLTRVKKLVESKRHTVVVDDFTST